MCLSIFHWLHGDGYLATNIIIHLKFIVRDILRSHRVSDTVTKATGRKQRRAQPNEKTKQLEKRFFFVFALIELACLIEMSRRFTLCAFYLM